MFLKKYREILLVKERALSEKGKQKNLFVNVRFLAEAANQLKIQILILQYIIRENQLRD